MQTFEIFRQQFQHALLHLHNLSYEFPVALHDVIFGKGEANTPRFRATVIQAIDKLRPVQPLPPDSRAESFYQVLYQRFVLGRTQENVAEDLAISVRSLQRLQREASHLLAWTLWERRQTDEKEFASAPNGASQRQDLIQPEATSDQPGDWFAHLHHELLLLQSGAENATSNLAEALAGTMRILSARGPQNITIEALPTTALEICFHPSILRQILLTLLDAIQRTLPAAQVRLAVDIWPERLDLRLSAAPYQAEALPDFSFVQELLALQGETLRTRSCAGQLELETSFARSQPTQPTNTVLVVEDNTDLIALYQSYCTGTRYRIVAVSEGRRLIEQAATVYPDVILLDIMLPDVDGWDLLLELHVHPLTKHIPIIVCSVVADEQLLLDLGAAHYLRKPVWRQHLLAAFDKVLGPGV